jgi:hypothetical protein
MIIMITWDHEDKVGEGVRWEVCLPRCAKEVLGWGGDKNCMYLGCSGVYLASYSGESSNWI